MQNRPLCMPCRLTVFRGTSSLENREFFEFWRISHVFRPPPHGMKNSWTRSTRPRYSSKHYASIDGNFQAIRYPGVGASTVNVAGIGLKLVSEWDFEKSTFSVGYLQSWLVLNMIENHRTASLKSSATLVREPWSITYGYRTLPRYLSPFSWNRVCA